MAEKKTTTAGGNGSVFATLSAIDCGEHIEQKKQGNGVQLSYLSWAWAWHICKQHYPDAYYTIYETPEGRPYFDDGRTCWVKTGVTIEDQEHIEYLPIMDYRNLSIPVDKVTSMDMNKAIQRSLTKALARHGLGLYIYAGEDLPWTEEEARAREAATKEAGYDKKPAPKKPAAKKPAAKKVEAQPAPQTAPKQPCPERHSADWNKWVEAIALDKPTKSGQKTDWMANFKKFYAWEPDTLDLLEEDVFNYKMNGGFTAPESRINP